MSEFEKLYERNVTNKLKETRNAMEHLIQVCLDEYSELSSIIIWGFTPLWQDGDRCYHEEHYAFIKEDGSIVIDCEIFERLFEYEDDDGNLIDKVNQLVFHGEDNVSIPLTRATKESEFDVLPWQSEKREYDRYSKLKELLNHSKEVELCLDTDFVLECKRDENGSVVITKHRYHPRY